MEELDYYSNKAKRNSESFKYGCFVMLLCILFVISYGVYQLIF